MNARGRVSLELPPGVRACENGGTWLFCIDEHGDVPFKHDVDHLRSRFPSAEARAGYMELIRERMRLAAEGKAPSDTVVQMQIAPDVLELKMPDHYFTGGLQHVRLYFSEPRELPGQLVVLRLFVKRPGPLGVADQDGQALEASELLYHFEQTRYRTGQ